jgi:hypothetical protein
LTQFNPIKKNKYLERKRYMLTEKEAMQLVLLELYRADGMPPRADTINRLLSYLVKLDKKDLKRKILVETGVKL